MCFRYLVLFSVLLSACVTTSDFQETDILRADNTKIIVMRDTETVQVFWNTIATMGVISGLTGGYGGTLISQAAASKRGSEMFAKYNIPDPSIRLEDSIVQHLKTKYGLVKGEELSRPNKIVPSSFKPSANEVFVDSHSYTDILGGLQGKYSIVLNISNRILDGNTGQKIMTYTCGVRAEKDASLRPTKDELLANDAELLKSEVSRLTDLCVEEVAAKLAGELPS